MTYSEDIVQHLVTELTCLNKPYVALLMKLQGLAEQFKSERAKVFMNSGVLRRLSTLMHCANSIYSIYPPDRTELLDKRSVADVTVYIQTFLINVYGVLDNVAWTLALEGGFAEPDKNYRKIGLNAREMQVYIPEKLQGYLKDEGFCNWFETYAKDFRDWTAHRIPPYLPPSTVLKENLERHSKLEKEAHEALVYFLDVDKHEDLNRQRKALYENSKLIGLSLSKEDGERLPFYLHAQLICDLMTVHELLNYLHDGLVEVYGFKVTNPQPLIKAMPEKINFFDL